MTFIRAEYEAYLQEAGSIGNYIRPQAVTVVYQLQAIPVANVEVTFGVPFETTDELEQEKKLDMLERWADGKTLLQIQIRQVKTPMNGDQPSDLDEVVFEGYLLAPSVSLSRKSASYTFQLQHWTRDLTIGSLLISYAMSGHPQDKRAAALYQSSLGGASVGSLLEGVAFRKGLPGNWKQQTADDIWANAQKPILASLLLKDFVAPSVNLFSECANTLNRPSQLAIAALERIQGPSKQLGSDYREGGVPLSISQSITPGVRGLLGQTIAKSIANVPIASFANTTVWDQVLYFCGQFGLFFVPRSRDAVLIPARFGMVDAYEVELNESEDLEVAWSVAQQSTLRGVGIMSTYTDRMNGAGTVSKNPADLPHGCHVGSDDPNDGSVPFILAPPWLRNVPSDRALSGAARRSAVGRGIHKPPATGEAATQEVQEDEQLNGETLPGIYKQYAKLKYFENALRGRTVRISGNYRTDIAVGTTLKVNLRPDRMLARLNLRPQSLVGIVMGVTLSVNRARRLPAVGIEMDYAITESQVMDPRYNLQQHPIFENTVRGLPLVTGG